MTEEREILQDMHTDELLAVVGNLFVEVANFGDVDLGNPMGWKYTPFYGLSREVLIDRILHFEHTLERRAAELESAARVARAEYFNFTVTINVPPAGGTGAGIRVGRNVLARDRDGAVVELFRRLYNKAENPGRHELRDLMAALDSTGFDDPQVEVEGPREMEHVNLYQRADVGQKFNAAAHAIDRHHAETGA